jgi:hypothetical protein
MCMNGGEKKGDSFRIWGEGLEGLVSVRERGLCLWNSGRNRGKEGRLRFLNEVEDTGRYSRRYYSHSSEVRRRWLPDQRH